MASLDILCLNLFNLKNKVIKILHKKIFRGPSKSLKNISWPINICLKYFMAPTKILRPFSWPPQKFSVFQKSFFNQLERWFAKSSIATIYKTASLKMGELRMMWDTERCPQVFLGKGVVKICSKFTGEHPCRCAILIKLQSALRHGWSPVNLQHILRTPFPRNTCGRLLQIRNPSSSLKIFIVPSFQHYSYPYKTEIKRVFF